MSRNTEVGIVYPPTSLKPDAPLSVVVTCSATPGVVTVLALPDTASVVRLFPRTNAIRAALSHAPDAVVTIAANDQAVALSDYRIGGICKPDLWDVRTLEPGRNRTLQISSLVASTVVDCEVY